MPPVAEQDAPTADRVLVSTPDASTLYMARRDDLRLVKKAIRTLRNREGDAVEDLPGETIQFRDGIFRVPDEGTVTLINGETIDAGAIHKWLEGHRLKGDWQEGFWRVDPTAPPISQDELDTMLNLALTFDAEGLRAFIAQEEAGWERDALLAPARGTLERVEKQMTERDAAIAKAREDGEAAAKKSAPKG